MWFDEKFGLVFLIVKYSLKGLSNMVVDMRNVCFSEKKFVPFTNIQHIKIQQ